MSEAVLTDGAVLAPRDYYVRELKVFQDADYDESRAEYQSLIDGLAGTGPISEETEIDAFGWASGLDCAGDLVPFGVQSFFDDLYEWIYKERRK